MATAQWHPFDNMAAHGPSLVVERADGINIWDDEEREYLDATAALWFCNVGYGRAEIADSVNAQIRKLPAYHTFGPYANAVTEELSTRIADLSPVPEGKVFLTSGGSDAVDTAAKLARRYWQLRGMPDKRAIINREYAYHGMHAFGTSLGGMSANFRGYGGRLVRETVCVSHDDVGAVEDLLARRHDAIAAIITEPVIGAGGVIPPSNGYLERLADLAATYDVLLIVDEVISGFGRLGCWFGSESYGLEPDMIVFAKGATSGYQPLGGVIVGPKVQEPFWSGEGAPFNHGYTYSGHPVACAAALANISIIEKEGLDTRVRDIEGDFSHNVTSLEECPIVSEVRTVGLMAAVEIAPAVREANSKVMTQLVRACWRRGVLTRPIRGVALQVSPALTVTVDELNEIQTRLRSALSVVTEANGD